MSISIVALCLLLADPHLECERRALLEWNIDAAPALSPEATERMATHVLAEEKKLQPADRAAILMRRGVARYHQGIEKAEDAASDFQQVLNFAPNDVVAQGYYLDSRGISLLFAGRSDEVIAMSRAARKLVRDNPKSPFARWVYANFLVFLPSADFSRHFEALSVLDEAIRVDPTNARVLSRRATVKFIVNDYEGSQRDAEAALVSGQRPEPMFRERMNFHLARCRIAMGDFEQAMNVLPDTCQVFPRRSYPQQILWMCASAAKKDATAELVADQMMERFPDNPEGPVAKAVSLALRGDHRGADEALKDASARRVNRSLIDWGRGRAYELAENWTAAVERYDAASFPVPLNVPPPADNDRCFSVDCALRLGLLRSAAPDEKARDGIKAVREGKRLVDALDECAERRMALLIIACGYAESRDFDEAVQFVDEALRSPGLKEGEKLLCSQLRKQFVEGRPYRLNPEKDVDPQFTIPAVACCMGRLKKIEPEKEFGEP